MPSNEGLGLRRVMGRVSTDWTLVHTRNLTVEDLQAAETMSRHVPQAPLKRLHERHHRIAQMLAAGVKKIAIAAELGVTPSAIIILRDDPTFCELVEYYRQNIEARFLDANEQMAGLNKDVILELRARLEEDAEKFSVGQLTTLMTVTADRTGNGPSSRSEVNITVGLADRLAEARRRIAERRTIDITPNKDAAE